MATVQQGSTVFGRVAGAVGVVLGVSVLSALVVVAGLGWPWVAVIVLLVLLLILGEGAYRTFDAAEKLARFYYPSWELVKKRADTLQSLLDAACLRAGEPVPVERAGEGARVQFRSQWIGGHRTAALRDYERAALAGHAPDVKRETIEDAELEDMPDVIAAFRAAAACWREAERTP